MYLLLFEPLRKAVCVEDVSAIANSDLLQANYLAKTNDTLHFIEVLHSLLLEVKPRVVELGLNFRQSHRRKERLDFISSKASVPLSIESRLRQHLTAAVGHPADNEDGCDNHSNEDDCSQDRNNNDNDV